MRMPQICPGCAHACVLPISFTSEGGYIQCNQTDVDYGLVELESIRTAPVARLALPCSRLCCA